MGISQPLDQTACAQADDVFYCKYKSDKTLFTSTGGRIPLKSSDPRCSEWCDDYEAILAHNTNGSQPFPDCGNGDSHHPLPCQHCTTGPNPAPPPGPAPPPPVTPVAPCPIECPTKVEFSPLGKKWGWDDLTDAAVPWMSIENGKSDTVKAKSKDAAHSGRMCNVIYKSSDDSIVDVTPKNGTSDSETLTLTGKKVGEVTITASCKGSEVGKFKVASYDLVKKKIAITLIHEKNYTSTDIADATAQDFCTKVYKQAVVEIALVRKPAQTVEFDLDKDGEIAVSGAWPGPELKKIIDTASAAGVDFNQFMVDNPDDNSLGWSGFSNAEKAGVAHVKAKGRGDAVAIEMTIAHETGHGLFGLKHPWDEAVAAHLKTDADNVMSQGDSTSKNKLRYFQWKKLH